MRAIVAKDSDKNKVEKLTIDRSSDALDLSQISK